MRFNNVLFGTLGAVLVTAPLNSSVIVAFAHVAVVHAARAAGDAPASA
jgi:hypothetical protein